MEIVTCNNGWLLLDNERRILFEFNGNSFDKSQLQFTNVYFGNTTLEQYKEQLRKKSCALNQSNS
jgi:hypothetical protein